MRSAGQIVLLFAVVVLSLGACTEPAGPADGPGRPDLGGAPDGGYGVRQVDVDFNAGEQGFVAGFGDYPQGQEALFELDAWLRPLPAPLDTGRRGFYLTGNNHSDDLFMYIRGRVAGLAPQGRYVATFDVELATDAPTGCFGIGGSPGESVWLKAGAVPGEPAPARLGQAVDKGNQAQGGRDALVLGTIGNSNRDCTHPRYELKRLAGPASGLATSAAGDGSLWIFVGTDSGFEGKTSIYFTRVGVTLTPM